MARAFDGVDDVIKVGSGGVTSTAAPVTHVAVMRKDGDGANMVPLRIHGSGNETRGGFQVNTANVLRHFGGSGTASSTFTVLASENWVLVGTTKASGTSTPRFHKYVFDTATWTHSDGDIAVSNVNAAGAGGSIWFGANSASLFLDGDLAAAAVYDAVLSDAQFEMLPISYDHWRRRNPVGMWLFNQPDTGTSVLDLTSGGADQTSITGTSVAADPAWPLGLARMSATAGVG